MLLVCLLCRMQTMLIGVIEKIAKLSIFGPGPIPAEVSPSDSLTQTLRLRPGHELKLKSPCHNAFSETINQFNGDPRMSQDDSG